MFIFALYYNIEKSGFNAVSAYLLLFRFFFFGLSSLTRIFHSYGDVTITGEGLQILTYARRSWPLSSEGS